MKILLVILVLGVVLAGVLVWGIKYVNEQEDNIDMIKQDETIKQDLLVFKPLVSGAFYPDDEVELKQMVKQFLDDAKVEATGKLRVLIVPHAGLVYSGQVAGYGFANLHKFSTNDTNTVVIIGVAHRSLISGVGVYPEGFYETPLGRAEIDADLSKKIVESSSRISYLDHQELGEENSLEVQFPFLQTVLPDAKFVLVLLGGDDGGVDALVRAIDEVPRQAGAPARPLVVISTDLSHYPEYEIANEVDKKTIEAVLTKDVGELDKVISKSMKAGHSNLDTCACGELAVKVGMGLAKEWDLDGELLKYANSGDVSGDHGQVVGYASIGFFGSSVEDEVNKVNNVVNKVNNDDELSEEDKKELLKIARETLEKYLKDGTKPKIVATSAKLQERVGAFVTLRRGDTHELRGCIGRFSPTDAPLYQVVQQMVIAAATEDIRFESVTYDELERIEIEISVLSAMKKIDDPSEIEVGKHGVEVRQGSRHGVFLPQVATENDWDLETFMNQLCGSKAGIAEDAWKTGEVDIYVFTADVFKESE